MIRELSGGYAYEADAIDKDTWHGLLATFDDATFYQTWSFGAVHWGENRLSHLVLSHDGRVVGLVQLQVFRVPLLAAGVAFVKWGPLWQKRGEGRSLDHLRMLLRAMHEEYAVRRGYLVRVMGKEVAVRDDDIRNVYRGEGFALQPSGYQTMILDLSPDVEALRRQMVKGHRESLRFAERQDVRVEEGSADRLMDVAMRMYREMKQRKKFVEFSDMEEIARANRDLPEHLKLRLAVCYQGEDPVGALGWSTLGKYGQVLTASTGNSGLRLKSSFLLWWTMFTYFKTRGFIDCDLAGVNPERNPGGFFFKKGLIGAKAEAVDYLGMFEAAGNLRSIVLFRGAQVLRDRYRALRETIERLLNQVLPKRVLGPAGA